MKNLAGFQNRSLTPLRRLDAFFTDQVTGFFQSLLLPAV
jgi:hypothetical protein